MRWSQFTGGTIAGLVLCGRFAVAAEPELAPLPMPAPTSITEAGAARLETPKALQALLGKVPQLPHVADDVAPRVQPHDVLASGHGFVWGDVRFFHDLRIQSHCVQSRFRLADRDGRLHALGDLDECERKLDLLKTSRSLEPMSGEAVILIHGIAPNPFAMSRMAAGVARAGYRAFVFEYPSNQVEIPVAARQLNDVVESLEGISRIHFVGHSMGGLVARCWMRDYYDKRVGRLVMLGSPNFGSEMADAFSSNPLYSTSFGPAGRQLCTRADGFLARLPAPCVEFGVVAGCRQDGAGWNPLIPGDDDGAVSVNSARHPAAADFLALPVFHPNLTSDARSVEATLSFLKSGRFATSEAE